MSPKETPEALAQAEKLLEAASGPIPGLEPFLRDLYRAGLIDGLRSLRSVTVDGERLGEEQEPGQVAPMDAIWLDQDIKARHAEEALKATKQSRKAPA